MNIRHLALIAMLVPNVIWSQACGRFKFAKSSSSTQSAATSEEPLSAGAPLLSAADLLPAQGFTRDVLDETEIVDELSDDGDVYDNQPEDGITTPCERLINAGSVKANSNSVVVTLDVDVTDCLNADPKKVASLTFSNGRYKVRVFQTCSSGDLSIANGKTLGEIEPIDLSKSCPKNTSIFESVITYTVTNSDPENRVVSDNKWVTLKGTSDMKGCQESFENDVGTLADGCEWVTKSEKTLTRNGQVTKSYGLNKFTPKGLQYLPDSKNAVWYKSGTLDLVYNDWTGTLSYSDPSTPPTYNLTQDGSSKKISGKLKSTAALRLMGSAAGLRLQRGLFVTGVRVPKVED